MKKTERQKLIVSLLENRELETQEELVDALRKYDHAVTQATVSRDTKEMGLVKVKGKTKRYRYAYIPTATSENSRHADIFKNCVVSIHISLNLIVMKTIAGSANAVGAALDAMSVPHTLGTIAGDDTVLIIADSLESVPAIVQILNDCKND